MLEQQFVTFLIERIEVKLDHIRTQTTPEEIHAAVNEMHVFVDELKQAMATFFTGDRRQSKNRPDATVLFKRHPGKLVKNRLNPVYRILCVESGVVMIRK